MGLRLGTGIGDWNRGPAGRQKQGHGAVLHDPGEGYQQLTFENGGS